MITNLQKDQVQRNGDPDFIYLIVAHIRCIVWHIKGYITKLKLSRRKIHIGNGVVCSFV